MRVKILAAAAGMAALTAVVAVPGISNASRLNTRTQPQVQTDTTTTQPVVETPTTPPVPETTTSTSTSTTTSTQPVVVEPTTQPKPVVPKPSAPAPVAPPVVSAPTPPPVVVTPPATPTVDVTKVVPPAQQPADPCHMDDYQAVRVDSLTDPGEAARAQKVDRNGNGVVCRKDIPGRGRGNTGNGSNIKDDQAG